MGKPNGAIFLSGAHMSEETEQSQEQEAPQGGETANGKAGTQFVDFTQLDPSVKARFDRIYSNMKQYERAMEPIATENRELRDRLERLEASDTQRTTQQALQSLNRQKVQALEEGDSARVVQIDDKLMALRTSPPIKEESASRERPAEVISDESAFTQADQAAMDVWSDERTERGSLMRPWADPNHQLHDKAARAGAAALSDPEIAAKGIDAVLTEIDRIMGIDSGGRAERGVPTNLSGDGNVRPRSGSGGLTDDQKFYAHKIYNKLSPKEAEEKYLKSAKKLGLV